MMLDQLISEFDRSLRALTGVVRMSRPIPQPQPDDKHDRDMQSTPSGSDVKLSAKERIHAAGLMRVNHVGEICAQALYQAQKLATQSKQLRSIFEQAAIEEEDHLSWTAHRLKALGSSPSLLNPLWYAGAFALGFIAGKMGHRASLGFMVETERQVEQHLCTHLEQLPAADDLSRAIIEQMRLDEHAHAQAASYAGSADLPQIICHLMRVAACVMTKTAYYL